MSRLTFNEHELTPLVWDRFATPQTAPLPAERAAEPGPGLGDVTDTGDHFSIDADGLLLGGAAGPADPMIAWKDAAGNFWDRAAGLALWGRILKHTVSQANNRFGFNRATPIYNGEYTCYFVSGGLVSAGGGTANFIPVAPWSLGGTSEVAIVLRNFGAYFLVDGKLAWIGAYGEQATVRPSFLAVATPGDHLQRAYLADLVAGGCPPWGARDLDRCTVDDSYDATPGDEEDFTHTPDALIRFNIEDPLTGYRGLMYRAVSAASPYNCWYAFVNPAGNVLLYEYIDNVPYQRGNVAAGLTGGELLTVVCHGATHKIYYEDTLAITYQGSRYIHETKVRVKGPGGTNFEALTLDSVKPLCYADLQVTDFGAHGLHGTPVAVGLDGTAGRYDRANSYTDIYSGSLAALFDGDLGTVIARCRVSNDAVWDGTNLIFNMRDASGDNNISFYSLSGSMILLRRAQTTAKYASGNLGRTLDWMNLGLTWDQGADELRGFFNGSQLGTTKTGNVAWAGTIASYACVIGAEGISAVNSWGGDIADFILVFGVAAKPTQVAAIHGHLDAGTLTTAVLDAIFGAGNYAWWRHTDHKVPTGFAADLLPGPLSAGQVFSHTPDFVLDVDMRALPASSAIAVRFRCLDDDNYWVIQAQSDGDFELFETVGGTPTSQAQAAGVLTGTERLRIAADDETIIGWYISAAGLATKAWEYNSAVNFKTETMGRLQSLGTGGALVDLIVRPRHPDDRLAGALRQMRR